MPWTKFAAPLLPHWLWPDSSSKCWPVEASSRTSVDCRLHDDNVNFRLQIPIILSLQQCVGDAPYSCAAFQKCSPGIMNIFAISRKTLRNTLGCWGWHYPLWLTLQEPVSDGLRLPVMTMAQPVCFPAQSIKHLHQLEFFIPLVKLLCHSFTRPKLQRSKWRGLHWPAHCSVGWSCREKAGKRFLKKN